MKYVLYLAVLPLLIINLLQSMESNLPVINVNPIVTHYPLNGNICRIHYINKERIILENEKNWTLLNPQTNQVIKHQSLEGMQHVAIHPHTNICAISHLKTINLHDINGKDIVEVPFNQGTPDIMDSTFSPDNILFIRHEKSNQLTKYNYEKDILVEAHLSRDILNIACHPTQDQVAFYTEQELILINTNLDIKKTIKLPQIPHLVHTECKYNLDGSLIAIGHGEKVHLIDPETDATSAISIPENQEDFFEDFIFYPNNNTLVTISQATGKINFWNVKTTALLATLLTGIKNGYGRKIILNFDEKELIISLKNKVLRVPVPFTIFESINNQ